MPSYTTLIILHSYAVHELYLCYVDIYCTSFFQPFYFKFLQVTPNNQNRINKKLQNNQLYWQSDKEEK